MLCCNKLSGNTGIVMVAAKEVVGARKPELLTELGGQIRQSLSYLEWAIC